MLKKVLLLTAFGAGYVLGARAGRERYAQIRKIALRVKDDPHVRQAVDDLGEVAKEQGTAVAHKVSGKVTGNHTGGDVPQQPTSADAGSGIRL